VLVVADDHRHQVGFGRLGKVQPQAVVAVVLGRTRVLRMDDSRAQQGGQGKRQDGLLHGSHGRLTYGCEA
jgi:hypothetical protein